MAAHIDTTDANFEKDINDKDRLVIVDMWAEWCGPCKMMEPLLNEIAEELKESVKLVKLNIDKNQKTAATYSVMNIPTLLSPPAITPVPMIPGLGPGGFGAGAGGPGGIPGGILPGGVSGKGISGGMPVI